MGKPTVPVLRTSQEGNPTEAAYLQWFEKMKIPTTAQQRILVQEILQAARALDQLLRTTMSSQGQVDLRLQLLRRLRTVSADLREEVADETIRQAVMSGGSV